MRSLLAFLVACILFSPGSLAQERKQPEEYMRLTFEARGRLKVRLDPKSGEVLDGHLLVKDAVFVKLEESWRLNFANRKDLKAAAKKLDGQMVLVTGDFLSMLAVEERSTTPRLRRSFDFPTLMVKTLQIVDKK